MEIHTKCKLCTRKLGISPSADSRQRRVPNGRMGGGFISESVSAGKPHRTVQNLDGQLSPPFSPKGKERRKLLEPRERETSGAATGSLQAPWCRHVLPPRWALKTLYKRKKPDDMSHVL